MKASFKNLFYAIRWFQLPLCMKKAVIENRWILSLWTRDGIFAAHGLDRTSNRLTNEVVKEKKYLKIILKDVLKI